MGGNTLSHDCEKYPTKSSPTLSWHVLKEIYAQIHYVYIYQYIHIQYLEE